MYIVYSHKPRRFKTLEAARAFAEAYFNKTGNIVAIVKGTK